MHKINKEKTILQIIQFYACLGEEKLKQALNMFGIKYDTQEITRYIQQKTTRITGTIRNLTRNENELEILINQEHLKLETAPIQEGDNVTIHKYTTTYSRNGYRVYKIEKNGQEYNI